MAYIIRHGKLIWQDKLKTITITEKGWAMMLALKLEEMFGRKDSYTEREREAAFAALH